MAYYWSIRGWMELSWPDADIEGVDETDQEHKEKVARIRQLLHCALSEEELGESDGDTDEAIRAGWCFPQSSLGGTEYVMFGADVADTDLVLAQIRQVLALDPYADGFFTVEGEDGESAWQWMILTGKILRRDTLFPDFEVEGVPSGFRAI